MLQTASPRIRRQWRKRWLLIYQDASGTPEDDVLERSFRTDVEAMAWADDHFIVPLRLDEWDELLGDNGNIIGSIVERHDI